MARHKEKDDEAGGEGLGFLATRKRLWRDADGNIVNTRRPHHTQKRQRAIDAARDQEVHAQGEAPPSPPTSNPSTSSHNHMHPQAYQSEENHNLLQDESADWPILDIDTAPPLQVEADPYDFLCNASWGTQPFQGLMNNQHDDELPFDDIFKVSYGYDVYLSDMLLTTC